MYCLNMLMIALELARKNRAYEDVATKFFEHFLYIAEALNNIAGEGISLWDEEDQFFYDVLHMPDDSHVPLKVRSLVGFIPLWQWRQLTQKPWMPCLTSRLVWNGSSSIGHTWRVSYRAGTSQGWRNVACWRWYLVIA